MTQNIHEHIVTAREQLRGVGISDAEASLSARLLAEFALGWSAERLLVDGHEAAPPDFAPRYSALVARRASREPLAYIVGRREFWGLPLFVSPAVLIPRSETELIVEAALDLFRDQDAPLDIADVCTGSGCVALALAHERPAARVVASDISAAALAVAQRNVAAQGLGSRVRLVQADLFGAINHRFDLITCNPPYVTDRSRGGLQPEVGDHEPAVALFGGNDGLRIIERLVSAAPGALRHGGYLLFEFGYGQDEGIEALVTANPLLELLEFRRDLQGIARVAVARSKSLM